MEEAPLTEAEQAAWEQICRDHDNAVEKGQRICPMCLTGVPRDRYQDHIENVHGFETLTIRYAGDLPAQEN